jgi:hypothetical protein
MSVAPRRRRVTGDRAFRRLLKRLPESAREEMADVLRGAGVELLAAMKADAPRRTGFLERHLTMKLLPRSLRLVVGFIGKRANQAVFYRWILETGRKAQTVRVYRRKKSQKVDGVGHRGRTFYMMRVSAMPARRYVYGRRSRLRGVINGRLRNAWDNILRRAGEGTLSDD